MSANGQRVIDAVRAKAAELPSHVYQGECVYVKDGKPGCLVGQGLWAIGLIGAWFGFGTTDNYLNIRGVNRRNDWGFDEAEIEWLLRVQRRQDDGMDWGTAVHDADGMLPGVRADDKVLVRTS
jgi:hypothetical protein